MVASDSLVLVSRDNNQQDGNTETFASEEIDTPVCFFHATECATLLLTFEWDLMVPCVVDTGCSISLIPKKFVPKPSPARKRSVMTAAGPIPLLGTWEMSLSLGLTADDYMVLPPFSFSVLDADLDFIFVGLDFIIYNRLVVNPAEACIVQPNLGIRLPLHSAPKGSSVFWLHFMEADHHSDDPPQQPTSTITSDTMSPQESQCLQLLESFSSIVQPPLYHNQPRHGYVLDITLTSPLQYPRMKARSCSLAHQQIIDDNFNDLVTRGAVTRGTSAYASPVTIVDKKDGTPRICVDYTRLNQHTADLQHAIPSIRSLPQRLHTNHHWFSTIDLKEAYYSLPLSDKAAHLATIVTQHGSYIPNRTMFGLKNAPSKFCELIADLIHGLESFVFAYLDDFIVFSTTFDEHLCHLEQLFKRINEFGLFVNTKKCSFAKHSVTFLGHTFSVEGMQPLQDKVQAIRNMSPPTTIKEVRRFLGCVNYYRPFLPHLAEVASPLTDLLSVKRGTPKSRRVHWGDAEQQAFQRCIDLLVEATSLNYEDHTRPLILCTDASLSHAGAALEQVFDSPQGEVRKPLAFFSKKFARNVVIRSTFNRELTAAYFAIRYFRHRILGRRCILKTDHSALVSAIINPTGVHSPIEERMLQFIKEFNLEAQHIDGAANQVADCLSRPAGSSEETLPDNALDHQPDSPACYVMTASCSTVPPSQQQHFDTDERLTLELISDEQLREPTLIPAVEQELASSRAQPKPTLCSVPTNAGSTVHAISSNDESQPRIVLPTSLRVIAFHEAHDVLHQGQERSLDTLSFQYFWPDMKRDIELWVKACPRCQANKISRHNRQKLCNFPSNSHRLRILHVDLVCPSTVSYRPHSNDTVGFRFILTMRDRATGFVVITPLTDKRTTTIMWALLLHYFAIFGPPDIVVADNGMEFASAAFHKFCADHGTKINHTTAYHPQSNGAIERVHRDLKTMMRSLPHAGEWAQHLPLFAMAYNNQACDVNTYTSFQHLFGQPGRLPGHLLSSDDLPSEGQISSIHTEAFMELMSWHRRRARSLPDNKPFIHKELETCEKVWLRNSAPHGNLAPLYLGPFEVIQRNEKYFTIKQDSGIKSVSVDRLKPFFELPAIPQPTRYNFRSLGDRSALKKIDEDFVFD